MFAPLYSLFASTLMIEAKDISFIWGLYSFVMAIFILWFGRYENTHKKGKSLVVGYFICAIASLLFLSVTDSLTLIIVLVINALGAGMTLPAYKTLYAQNESNGKESEQWSWFDSGTMLAAAIGGAFGGLVVGMYGFSGIFIAMSLTQLIAALIAYKVLYKLS